MSIRVSIIEDDPILLETYSMVIQDTPACELRGSHATAASFQSTAADELPDVVIVDINLPDMNGIELVRLAKQQHPNMQFLMCTVQDDDDNLFNALCAGATGYLVKDAHPERLVAAVHDLHTGGSPMSPGLARRLIKHLQQQRSPAPEILTLTDRERQVLDELSQGFRYKEIADRLGVSMDTVRTHIRNLYDKLQVSSRTDALNKLFPR